jgi:anhydro-N-acetylmuramic acid kinase
MDTWCNAHTGKPYDAAGSWAASGSVHAGLLSEFLRDPFFAKLPPKSTGRDLFNGPWLTTCLDRIAPISANDVQATLAELTALSCARAIQDHLPQCSDLYVCGGGAFNAHLLGRIQAALPATHVATTTAKGVHPQQVEAAAFAWLAQQTLLRKTASVKSVTGARGARILGAIYPA